MKWHIARHNIEELVLKKNFACWISAGLLASNILLCWKIMNASERWVLIPQWDINREIALSGSHFSDEYLIDWAGSMVQDLYTANPQSIDRKTNRFLALAATTYGLLRETLMQQAEVLKKERFSTAFYPKKMIVDQAKHQITIIGDFMRFFADDTRPVVTQKTFQLSYSRGPRGVILVEQLQEVKHED